MPYRITIYCQQPVAPIDAAAVLKCLQDADLWLLAEAYEIDEDLVEPALAHLKLDVGESNGSYSFEIIYREPDLRQIQVELWSEPQEVAEVLQEANESLEEKPEEVAAAIKQHLEQTREIVFIELGYLQLENMGIVLGNEVARWFAMHCRGIVEDGDGQWFTVDEDGVFKEP